MSVFVAFNPEGVILRELDEFLEGHVGLGVPLPAIPRLGGEFIGEMVLFKEPVQGPLEFQFVDAVELVGAEVVQHVPAELVVAVESQGLQVGEVPQDAPDHLISRELVVEDVETRQTLE